MIPFGEMTFMTDIVSRVPRFEGSLLELIGNSASDDHARLFRIDVSLTTMFLQTQSTASDLMLAMGLVYGIVLSEYSRNSEHAAGLFEHRVMNLDLVGRM